MVNQDLGKVAVVARGAYDSKVKENIIDMIGKGKSSKYVLVKS